MKRPILWAVAAFALTLSACSPENATFDGEIETLAAPRMYLVSSANRLPNNFDAIVARNNDVLHAFHAEAGFASVTTRRPQAYRRYADIVVPNVPLERDRPDAEPVATTADEIEGLLGNPPTSLDDDPLFDLQWGNDAVNAPEAYNAGVTGQGVRVAVLDGGFDMDHPDLAPNINYDLSKDFTGEGLEYGPNCPPGVDPPDSECDLTGIFSHGTHVAGTIGAANNGLGTIGVAPEAELVLVKVLFNYGSGTFEDVLEGILYAGSIESDVINMSLGADIPQGLGIGSDEIAALRTVMNRAIGYASQQGATVIVAAGNDGRDLDKDRSVTVFPASMPHAISISALGPEGWGADPSTDLETLAYYSNYGRSGVDFGAPGGDYELIFTDLPLATSSCTVAGLMRPCYVFDFVYSTGGNGLYYWSVGTSMAAPHAAGVAALIISENGGSMPPAQVETEMARRAADLGTSGKDPIYGLGAVRSGY